MSKKEELTSKIKEYFKEQSSSLTIDVHYSNDDRICTISLSQMLSGVAKYASFKHLSWLSELLGTEEIDIDNHEYNSGGCDSCDWGSLDSIDLICYNIKIR